MGPKSDFFAFRSFGDMIYAFLLRFWCLCFNLSIIIIHLANRLFSILSFDIVFLPSFPYVNKEVRGISGKIIGHNIESHAEDVT